MKVKIREYIIDINVEKNENYYRSFLAEYKYFISRKTNKRKGSEYLVISCN